MIVAEVIPITSSILTESLSYFSATEIIPGAVVTIPLRKKEIKGIVISTTKVENLKQNLRNQNFKIRNIIKVHKETVFSAAYLTAINQLKNYFALPAGKLINITYPKYITKNFSEFAYTVSSAAVTTTEGKLNKQLIQKTYPKRIEYYKKFISKSIQDNKSVHIICPIVLSTKKISEDLSFLLKKQIYTLHGKISKKKLTESYQKIQDEISIVISTPGFIDIPILNKSTVILEQDSSSYYNRAVAPHIDFRVLIEQYAKNSNLDLIISDSILRPFRFEEEKKFINTDMEIFSKEKISLISSFDVKKIKQTDTERIKSISEKKDFSPFSNELLKEIKKSVNKKEKIFFYAMRKSLAPSINCRDCGKLAQDIDTKTPYSLYTKINQKTKKSVYFYINKISGEVIQAFDTCQFCGSWKLQTIGIGTETVQDELKKIFPKLKTYIIDSTHSATQTSLNNILKEFNKDDSVARVLIGTQKALPHLSSLNTSFIISIDGIFHQQSYTNETRALSTIKQIYDNSFHTYIQTRSANKNQKKDKTKNVTLEKKEDVLQIKFSKRLALVMDKIKYSPEIQKHMTSKYTEALDIWNVIRSGNYAKYVKKSNGNRKNNKTILKINHICKKSDYLRLLNIYKERFNEYNHIVKQKPYFKKGLIILSTSLFIDKKLWNIDYQDQKLYQKLPFGERSINIEINPDVF